MWPDPRDGRDHELDDAMTTLPFDAELDALDRELAAAGTTARTSLDRGGASRPDRAFASSLRRRLLAAHAAEAGDAAAIVTTGTAAPLPSGPAVHDPVAIAPRIARRTPAVLPAPRWTFAAIAAALIVAVVGLNGPSLFPSLPSSRAGQSVGASLLRDGVTGPLVAGAELRAGDSVSTDADGHATLELGGGRVRLAGDTTVRIDRLEAGRIDLGQLAGRAWHRVVVEAGSRYSVATAGITWTATGTAFDVDLPADGATVRAVAVEHDVSADGPGLHLDLQEGRSAVIGLAAGPPTVETTVAGLDDLLDPWLVANARADARLGHPLGAMAGLELALASPSPFETPAPSTAPTTSADPSASTDPSVAPIPTPTPTVKPTPTPTATAKPTPTPAPTLGALSLTVKACPGGNLLTWSAYGGGSFDHYTTLRSASSEIPLAYPPEGGAVDFGTSYLTDPSKTEAFDASVEAGQTAWYRTMTFGIEDQVLAASPAKSATARATVALGILSIESPASGSLTFTWTPFGGAADCFTFYKLVKSIDDPTPSYLEGADTLAAISEQGASGYAIEGWTPGSTYYFRLQAIRATQTGKFVVAETAPIQYTVP